MQIELKEGKHFEVDRDKGTITFKGPICKGAKTRIDFPMSSSHSLRKVSATMETGFFRGWWFLLVSSLTRAR